MNLPIIMQAQKAALAKLHGAIDQRWGKKYFPIIHALEAALQAMGEFHPDIDGPEGNRALENH